MTTPEGKTKSKVKQILSRYSGMFSHWPVPSGFGRSTIDCLGCYRGQFFGIEVKPVGGKPTLRQVGELERIGRAMGQTFVLAGADDPRFDDLIRWLDHLKETIDDDPDIPPDEVNRRPL